MDGEYYAADSLPVFNMVVSFRSSQTSGEWIKTTMKKSDGWRSMEALRRHLSGEGTATRNIEEVERLNESLHYKSEREISFEIFITQCQNIFNIYIKEVK